MKITIVGNGVWGNALLSVVSQNTKEVTIAKRGEKIFADIVVLAVPTQSIQDVLPLITFDTKRILINSSKGIEQDTHHLPFEIAKRVLGEDVAYFTLAGPSFAQEVSQHMPTLVNLGYKENREEATEVAKIFQTPSFSVRLSQGVETLEVAAALKNIYAIACGIADGLGYKTNTTTQLIILAIEELHRLFTSLDVFVDPAISPEVIGDIILTCGRGSRNFNFGRLLPTHSVEKALEQIASTIEGYNTAKSVAYLEEKGKTSLPVAHLVKDIIGDNNPQTVLEKFTRLLEKQ